ncbi:MAG: hypothetical protein A2Y25_07700 [Candidatus Melainabacteria bacterium GWF2_37_15]|nr:MAG: hypothetical protein A2Y25_07700 [Candidatus Melainabacteria bacterium GWF2_37_15]
MFSSEIKEKQPFAARFLEESALTRLNSSYILTGNNTEDMLILAKETARILNCAYKTEDCTCVNCSWVRQDTHPAVIMMEPEKTVVTIAQARELKQSLFVSSQYHRVIIFPKADYKTLHSESANALLKIIEEPPQSVTFFFFTRDREDMLDTIVSRSQIVPLRYATEPVLDFSVLGEFPPASREDALMYAEKLLKADLPPEDVLERMQQYLILNIKENSVNREFCLKNIDYLKNIQKAGSELKSYVSPQAVLDSLLLSRL